MSTSETDNRQRGKRWRIEQAREVLETASRRRVEKTKKRSGAWEGAYEQRSRARPANLGVRSKTWPCCGHDISARRAADALTIITTRKKLGVDPRRYIRGTLRRILDAEKNLTLLLPENYKSNVATRLQESLAA
ncbi:MAG: hypothetical protein RL701_1771 [Pseudomonadota bacterium]|jgi:hypothetical protein